MEKKPGSRSSQSQTKTQNSETKKTQDTTGSKPWPRSSKKRESPNGSSKNDGNRKPPPQKGKSFDKRPRPRGAYHGGAMAGKQETRLGDETAEVGSVFLPGSKKQNLNHLLNFQFSPRDGRGMPRGGQGGHRKHQLVSTNKHKHNKDLFLQSNCQFVVKVDGDYTIHLNDPDAPVNWDMVEQINVRVSEPLCCPICLGEVVAGRVTRCGHSYCWPCLLHYFALSEDQARPCPICFQPINKLTLKSVQGVWQEGVDGGGKVNMRLMRRWGDSTLVEPAPPLDPGNSQHSFNNPQQLLSVSDKNNTTLFSKILTADTQDIMNIISRERQELNQSLRVDSDNPEYCFIQQALNELQQRESQYSSLNMNYVVKPNNGTSDYATCDTTLPLENKMQPVLPSIAETSPENGNILQNNITPPHDVKNAQLSGDLSFINDYTNLMYEAIATPPSTDVLPVFEDNTQVLDYDCNIITVNYDDYDVDTSASIASSSNPKTIDVAQPKYYYFYQASDGQAVFLESLEIRILESSWGSLHLAPRELSGFLQRRSSGSVSEEARRRLGCLRHLPIHCPFDMVQLDLKQPYVTQKALGMFKEDLEARKRERERRAREEKRRERVISAQEQRMLGKVPGLGLSLFSELHFPSAAPPVGLDEFPSCTQQYQDDSPNVSSNSGLSFAKMASGSGSWGSRPLPCSNPSTSADTRTRYDSEGSEGELGGAPSYNVSLSDAISAALLNTSISSQGSKKEGKKKKNKTKVLFATGIQHRTISD